MLKDRQKFQLIRHAAKSGTGALLTQARLIFLDTFIRQKHLVFRGDVQGLPRGYSDRLSVSRVSSAGELPQSLRKTLQEKGAAIDIGDLKWLEMGWTLWLGYRGDQPLCLAWTRTAEQSRDFFIELPSDAMLFWHIVTFPEARGQGLHLEIWRQIIAQTMDRGVGAYFTNCREYNLPSYRNIVKAGFKRIGCFTVNKMTGSKAWHPEQT